MWIKATISGQNDGESVLQMVHLMLNDDNMFFMKDQPSGYRGILGSIRIADIFDPTGDNVKMGQCCENIGLVSKMQMGSEQDTPQGYFCFQVDDTNPNTK